MACHQVWFESVSGIYEATWVKYGCRLNDLPLELIEAGGSFKTQSVAELRHAVVQQFGVAKKGTSMNDKSLRVVVRGDMHVHDAFFDTSELQAQAPNGAVFQVASAFNTLDVGPDAAAPLSGKFLSRLMKEEGQAASASGGAAAGTLVRLARHAREPIALLAETPVRNCCVQGRLLASDVPPFLADTVCGDSVAVGVQRNVVAAYRRGASGFCLTTVPVPRVHQVFCGALVWDLPPQGDDSPVRRMYNKMLRVAYEAAYLVAVLEQAPMLVLTVVGGGKTAQDRTAVARAIGDAHRRWAGLLPEGCIIKLPLYRPTEDASWLCEELRKIKVAIVVVTPWGQPVASE